MFKIDDTTALRLLRAQDAPELFALTDLNRKHLRAQQTQRGRVVDLEHPKRLTDGSP